VRALFHSVSNGIRVTARPHFAEEHSDATVPRYVFVYRIRIENVGDVTAQLLWRHWDIHDDVGGDSEVEGQGVIGEQPTLAPGDVHEYESFCVLQGTSGYMEGFYVFRRSDGKEVQVSIPRFLLHVSTDERTN
jgi:ApaG protein